MAVKKPSELDFSDKKFMVIISGQPGLGKTTLALSAPSPFLFDTDHGIARIKAEHRCISSDVSSYEELLEDMQSQEYKESNTAVIDTGGTLVQLMKDWARGQLGVKLGKDGRAIYGVIKTEFDRLCYKIRATDNKHLIVIFHTTEQTKGDTIQTRLSCEGSTKDIVWTPADMGGHMFMMGSKRCIGFTPTDEYFAKGCFGVSGIMEIPDLNNGKPNTFFTDLFAFAQDNINKEMEQYGGEKAKYDSAISTGMEYISAITNSDSAIFAKNKIMTMEHFLTSKVELKSEFKKKLKELGLKYDKASNNYVHV